MGRYRALLIGASDYEMRGVSSLPFIPRDLARLGAALEDRGFDEVQILAGREGGKQVSANYVNARVAGFLRRARPGDTLLVLLSGHGVHAKGRDYLVPEDIDEDTHPFESGCVAIDWRQHLDETPADHVVFLIDACREGIEQETMGVTGVKQWSRQKISAALRRKVAYVYACSPAQLALFVRPHESPVDGAAGIGPGESFSIFSRSVSDVLSVHPDSAALSLSEFEEAVQDRMAELHKAYRKKGEVQTLRVVTDIPSDTFFFLPLPGTPTLGAARPSPSGTTTKTAIYDSATMSVGANVSEPLERRRRPRSGWRVLFTLALLGLLGALFWEGVTFNGNNDGGGKSSKAGPEASLTPKSSGSMPSPSKDPSRQEKSDVTGESKDGFGSSETAGAHASAGSMLPACTASAVKLTVRSLQNAYEPGKNPALELAARNSSGSDCTVDLGPENTVLTITPADGDAPYWSSDDCPVTSESLVFRVPAGSGVTDAVPWNRRPSAPDCATPPAGSAEAGTYLVTVEAPGFAKTQTSFVLLAD
ncbi:caspase family protein [Streptomyces sp. NPDC002787]